MSGASLSNVACEEEQVFPPAQEATNPAPPPPPQPAVPPQAVARPAETTVIVKTVTAPTTVEAVQDSQGPGTNLPPPPLGAAEMQAVPEPPHSVDPSTRVEQVTAQLGKKVDRERVDAEPDERLCPYARMSSIEHRAARRQQQRRDSPCEQHVGSGPQRLVQRKYQRPRQANDGSGAPGREGPRDSACAAGRPAKPVSR